MPSHNKQFSFICCLLIFVIVISFGSVYVCTGFVSCKVDLYPEEFDSMSTSYGGGGFVVKKNSKSLKKYANFIGGVSSGTSGKKALSNHKNSNHLTYQNSFGRVGGGKWGEFGKTHNTRLFSESGKRAFGTNTGAGFAGRASAGLASIESFHRYKQYKAMIKYKKYGRYKDYSGRGLYYPHRYHNCYGGCYSVHSYCDFGICRCKFGYYPMYGSCWDNIGYGNDMSHPKEVAKAENSHVRYDPSLPCSSNDTCQKIDMNLICSEESKKCKCREDMRWNSDALECQVYIDVNCKIFYADENPDSLINKAHQENPKYDSPKLFDDLNPKWNDCVDDEEKAIAAGLCMDYIRVSEFMNTTIHLCKQPYYESDGLISENKTEANNTCHLPTYPLNYKIDALSPDLDTTMNDCTNDQYIKYCPKTCNYCKEKWMGEYGGLNIEGIQLPNYNVTEDEKGDLSFDITALSPNQTLSTSQLKDLNLTETEPMELKKYFCLEVHAISIKYSEPERIKSFNLKREQLAKEYQEKESSKMKMIGVIGIAVAVILIITISTVIYLKLGKKKKENDFQNLEMENSLHAGETNPDSLNEQPPPTFKHVKYNEERNELLEDKRSMNQCNNELPYSLNPPRDPKNESNEPRAPLETSISGIPDISPPPYSNC